MKIVRRSIYASLDELDWVETYIGILRLLLLEGKISIQQVFDAYKLPEKELKEFILSYIK